MLATVALARASRAKGLFYLSLFVAGSWAVGMAVFFWEVAAGQKYPFAYPAIDGIAAGLIMVLATRPNYPGRAPLFFVAGLLLIQALYRLTVTAYGVHSPGAELNIPYLVNFGVNRLFEVILISIWVFSALRILRIHHPELHKMIWRSVGVLPKSDPTPFDAGRRAADDIDIHVGAKLRQARRGRGWSVERLASECSLAPADVELFESGGRTVPPNVLLELSRMFGVKLSYFTDGLEAG